MRTGRPKQPLLLTEEERERMQSWAHRSRSQPLLARRARVVLACAEGLDNKTVAKDCAACWAWWASGARGFFRRAWRGCTMSRARALRAKSAMSSQAGGDSNPGEHTARADPLEYARTGENHWTEPHDDEPDLARIWLTAAPCGRLSNSRPIPC